MSQPAILEVPNVMLQKGGFLPSARLSYKTLGELNADRSNAVLVPSWYTGTHADTEAFMIGTNRALDPGKYFIILTDLLGNGLSSSPSNTPPPFEQARFPRITIHDNVRLQHQLITETLGIHRLRLVTGWSMGACQTYQWAAQYPDMVAAACPIAGSARTASFSRPHAQTVPVPETYASRQLNRSCASSSTEYHQPWSRPSAFLLFQ